MKKPWNLANIPVYSLATYDQQHKVNMNLCTYVSAVSMHPKLFAIGVYQNTRTLMNLRTSETAILQWLNPSHLSVAKHLGFESGKDFDKEIYLSKKNFLVEWEGNSILKNLSAIAHLKRISSMVTGDHELFIFEVLKAKTFQNDLLYLNHLREKKWIRI